MADDTTRLSELLWKLAQELTQWLDDRGRVGRIIPGRDNDFLTFRVATKDAFERAYSALLLGYGDAAEAIQKLYGEIEDALSVRQIQDPQQWADATLSAAGNLLVRCQLLARELAASEAGSEEAASGPGAISERFAFLPGQALFDGRDLGLPTGLATNVLKLLVDSFGHVVPYETLDGISGKTAEDNLRGAVRVIRKDLKKHRVPCEIVTKAREGYVIRKKNRRRRPGI